MTRALLLIAALVLLPAAARAELAIQARGSAAVTGGDVAGAKTRALEDAFRQAVDQAVGQLVDAAAREASAAAIKKRILRRARAYVVRYKVTSEGESEGVYAITVDAAVADGPLGADLQALGVGQPPAAPTTDEPPLRPAARPPLVVLAVSTDGTRTWASFGRAGGDGGPVAAALEHELGARGFKIAPAGKDIPVSVEGGRELPLDTAQAQSLARAAGAGGALVAAARIQDGGRVRGTRQLGAEVALRLRLDDAATGTLAAEEVSAAGFGADADAAAASAARAAAVRAGRAFAARLESHWPEPGVSTSQTGILVAVKGLSRAADLDAVVKVLTTTPGIKAVLAQRFARREVTLLVRGGAVRAIAEAVTRAPPPGTLARATAKGREVEVQLSVDSTLPPTPIVQPR